ncbi:MAG: hypothetical protein ACC656_02160 [Candidatus Heimdallarchaeota archaeon]
METYGLEIIFNCACEFYDELEIKNNKPHITNYIIYINDLDNQNDFFDQSGVSISLCLDEYKKLYYIECYGIKQQIEYECFKNLKKLFVNKYFDIENNNNKQQIPKIQTLFQKMKEKTEKQTVQIISDIDIENVDSAQELLTHMINKTFKNQITIGNQNFS